jgi:hypothetical protein
MMSMDKNQDLALGGGTRPSVSGCVCYVSLVDGPESCEPYLRKTGGDV